MSKQTVYTIITIVVIILCFCALPLIVLKQTDWFAGWEKNVGLGDLYNVVGAVFTACAFGGLLLTLYLQEQQIRKQAAEQLAANRERLEEQARTHLWDTFHRIIALYQSSPPDSAHITNMTKDVKALQLVNDRGAIGKVATKYIHLTSRLVLLATFCDLAMSADYPTIDKDRKIFATIIVSVLGLDGVPLLGHVAARTERVAFMALIFLCSSIRASVSGYWARRQERLDENLNLWASRRAKTGETDETPDDATT